MAIRVKTVVWLTVMSAGSSRCTTPFGLSAYQRNQGSAAQCPPAPSPKVRD